MRKKPDKATYVKLHRFYGGKYCVIDGKGNTDWHHLDDDESHSKFINLIPIGRDYNLRLRDVAKPDAQATLLSKLEPYNLLKNAQILIDDWKPARAYACARLASFVSSKYLRLDSTHRVKFICQSLYCARHTLQYELVDDVLDRDVEPILQTPKLDQNSRHQLLLELTGLLVDHGKHVDATELFQSIAEVAKKELLSTDALRHASIVRREAGSIIANEGKLTVNTLAMLDEAGKIMPHANVQASILNSKAWGLVNNGEYRKALSLLEPVVPYYLKKALAQVDLDAPWDGSQSEMLKNFPISLSPGNFAELCLNFGIASLRNDPKSKIGARALKAFNLTRHRTGWLPFMLNEKYLEDELPLLRAHEIMAGTFRLRSLPPETYQKIKETARKLIHGA